MFSHINIHFITDSSHCAPPEQQHMGVELNVFVSNFKDRPFYTTPSVTAFV